MTLEIAVRTLIAVLASSSALSLLNLQVFPPNPGLHTQVFISFAEVQAPLLLQSLSLSQVFKDDFDKAEGACEVCLLEVYPF